jgi:beta-lactam-binding protein with PASTA domain
MAERYAEDGEFVERFRREAQAAARLNHPNIIAVYDRGEADGRPYIAMEYLQGRTLKQVIQKEGPLSPERAIAVAMQVLAGLRYAHEHGVVHRDVKPHNVLVGDDGRIKVTDFGIAHAGDPQMTEVGSIVGTAQYLSPEQARGRSVGPQTDIYSLGVVLYEMLAGRVPFEGDSSVAIAMQHVSDEPPPLRSLAPLVPDSLGMVVGHAMLKDPSQRYASADEFAADLERFARGAAVSPVTEESATQIMRLPQDPIAATAATMIAPGRRTARLPPSPPPVYYDLEEPIHRRPVWPWIAALLFVIGAGIGAWFLYTEVSDKLNSTKPVAVELYLNLSESAARAKIKADGFAPVVDHHASRTTQFGLVFKQDPIAGQRRPKGSDVHIWVSTGVPKAQVPDLSGQSSTDAVAALTRAGLKADLHNVPSSQAAGTVLAQDPRAGVKIPVGQSVRLNISKGPQPVAVPSVVNEPIDQASSVLQALGFQVRTKYVEAGDPANTVIDQSPSSGESAGKGSIVTLTVSKGPKTSPVPDVTSYDLGLAQQTLQASGFRSNIAYQDVSDPSQDGVVLDQSPKGGTQAAPKTVVGLTVGRLPGGDTTATTDTTTTTP